MKCEEELERILDAGKGIGERFNGWGMKKNEMMRREGGFYIPTSIFIRLFYLEFCELFSCGVV